MPLNENTNKYASHEYRYHWGLLSLYCGLLGFGAFFTTLMFVFTLDSPHRSPKVTDVLASLQVTGLLLVFFLLALAFVFNGVNNRKRVRLSLKISAVAMLLPFIVSVIAMSFGY